MAKWQRRGERPSLIQAQDPVPRANQPAPEQKSGRGWNLCCRLQSGNLGVRYYNSVSNTGYSCSTVKAGSEKMLVTAPRVLESMESTIASLNSHALAAT